MGLLGAVQPEPGFGRVGSIVMSRPRSNDACDIADQGNGDAGKGNAEPIELAQHDEPSKHGETNCEQIGGAEEKLSVIKRQEAKDEAKQDEPHAVTGIEAHPSSQHSCFVCDAQMNLTHCGL